MKPYAQLTLLSSSLFLASFSLQAEVVQIVESVSSVVYQGEQAVAVVEPSVVPVPTKSYENVPEVVAITPVDMPHITALAPELVITELAIKSEIKVKEVTIIHPLPLKITPRLDVAGDVAVMPPLMPTSMLVNPILNTSELTSSAQTELDDEPSLFSAISDWFSVKEVKPWQKGTLAKKAMKPGGEVPEFDFFSEKVFAYKQGSIGGNGVGGGGCGCN
ncbi:MAG: hypothetical protein ACI935_002991 [Moritella dasanensis]|jgi:hypothetical protein